MTNKYLRLAVWIIMLIPVAGHGQSLPYACAGSQESYGVMGMLNSVYDWTVDGGLIVSGQGNDTIIIQWDYNRRSHTISVSEYTESGCIGTPVSAALDINAPVADIGDEEAVCEDNLFTFDGTTNYTSAISYVWPDGSTGPTYSTGTEGYVWVRVTGADNCADYDSAYLTLNPLPGVFLGNDTVLCGTESMILDPGFYSTYEWSTGDINHQIEVDGNRVEPEMFWVEVTDENGCRGSDTIMMEVCDAALLFLNMPNTITPGDGNNQNDFWRIPNVELFPNAVLEIYDRWGRLVYRTDDITNNPWRGQTMTGKDLPMDAYFFVLDIRVTHVKPFSGYVNVIR